MKPIPTLSSLLASFALFNWSAQASVLVSWNFGTTSGTLAGSIVDTTGSVATVSNVTSTGATILTQTGGTNSNLVSSGGGTGTGLDYIAPYSPGTWSNFRLDASNFGASPSSATFVSFSLTMAGTIDPTVSALEGIRFDLAAGGAAAPRGFEVTYRIGTSGSFTSLGTTRTPTTATGEYGRFTFNLSSPASLATGDVIEFRLLGYAPNATATVRLDNVSITAVPEPSTLALLLAAAGMLVLLRRRAKA